MKDITNLMRFTQMHRLRSRNVQIPVRKSRNLQTLINIKFLPVRFVRKILRLIMGNIKKEVRCIQKKYLLFLYKKILAIFRQQTNKQTRFWKS